MDVAAVKLVAALILAGVAATAAAHPVDEVVQAAYISVAPGRIRLQLDITPGPAVAASVLRAIDADGDGKLTRTEGRAYALLVLRHCALSVDGKTIAWQFDQVGVPDYGALARMAGTVQVFAEAASPVIPRAHRLEFRNGYRPARGPTTANIFAAPDYKAGFSFQDQRRSDDGRHYGITAVRL